MYINRHDDALAALDHVAEDPTAISHAAAKEWLWRRVNRHDVGDWWVHGDETIKEVEARLQREKEECQN